MSAETNDLFEIPKCYVVFKFTQTIQVHCLSPKVSITPTHPYLRLTGRSPPSLQLESIIGKNIYVQQEIKQNIGANVFKYIRTHMEFHKFKLEPILLNDNDPLHV